MGKLAEGAKVKIRREIGEKFRMLTVLQREPGRVLCRCDCGNELWIGARYVDKHAPKSSCGCFKRRWRDGPGRPVRPAKLEEKFIKPTDPGGMTFRKVHRHCIALKEVAARQPW